MQISYDRELLNPKYIGSPPLLNTSLSSYTKEEWNGQIYSTLDIAIPNIESNYTPDDYFIGLYFNWIYPHGSTLDTYFWISGNTKVHLVYDDKYEGEEIYVLAFGSYVPNIGTPENPIAGDPILLQNEHVIYKVIPNSEGITTATRLYNKNIYSIFNKRKRLLGFI